MAKKWTEEDDRFLQDHYPNRGKMWCAEQLGRTATSIRARASRLGLKQKRDGDFFRDWQERARQSKVGSTSRARSAAIKEAWADPEKYKSRQQKKLPLRRPTAETPNRDLCPYCEAAYKLVESVSCRKCIWKARPHPRGATGMEHSQAARKKISEGNAVAWQDPNSGHNSEARRQQASDQMKALQAEGKGNRYSRGRGGTREDLGFYVRSRWEANYARYLKFQKAQGLIFHWQYEPDVFDFPIKRGIRSYTPDFKVWDQESSEPYYVEIKGWMDAKSKTKLGRMAKYHPEIEVRLVQQDEMKQLAVWMKAMIPEWE